MIHPRIQMPNWNSQARQDEFVWLVLQSQTGTFLDIGSHDPITISNTYALEQMGWHGFLFDIDGRWSEPTSRLRTSPLILTDVSTFNWNAFLEEKGLAGTQLDYLSLDVDEASLNTLRRFPLDRVSFRVCTIEHDRYRFGQAVATEMRDILQRHGYILVCKDVANEGNPYEDWYVHESLKERVNGFFSDNQEWTDVLKTARTHFLVSQT